MKNRLKRLCIWYLAKYYPPTLERIKVNADTYEIEFGGYVKDNRNWYHVCCSISAWIRAENKNEALFDEVGVYVDGDEKEKYSFAVPKPKNK